MSNYKLHIATQKKIKNKNPKQKYKLCINVQFKKTKDFIHLGTMCVWCEFAWSLGQKSNWLACQ